MKKVQFNHRDIHLAGHLYTPATQGQKYPAIIVVHPGGGVKEQTSGLYAKLLAEQGFVTLAYDASHQGESGGLPRYLEDPALRMEDISAAVDFLVKQENVDANRIGVLGICAGGGYAINATLFDRRIKALATVSAVDINGLFRANFGENPVPALLELMNNVGGQRTSEEQGAETLYINYVPNSVEEFTPQTPEYAKEAYDYYRTPRAQCEAAANKLLFRSIPKIFAFDAFSQVPDFLTQPTLLVVGKNADTAYFSENLFQQIQHQNKELYWVENATHVSLYDYDVPQALPKIAAFFSQNL
ncbi:hypothetical protein A4G19_00475 [Pasteurellaceae bacterium Macca]|nr:hypothetical protein [Pasteurellaceae bacterium Macca]